MILSEEGQKQAYVEFMSAAIQAYIREGYIVSEVIEKSSIIAVKAVQQMKRDFS